MSIKELKTEFKKIKWPSRGELLKNLLLIVVVVAAACVCISLFDAMGIAVTDLVSRVRG